MSFWGIPFQQEQDSIASRNLIPYLLIQTMPKTIIRKYYKFIFTPPYVDARLDNYLIYKLQTRYTRTIIHKLIIIGNVYINKQQIKTKQHVLKSKDIIEIFTLYINQDEAILKGEQCINLRLIYEDEYLLIINKQFNLVVHPGVSHQEGTLLNGLKYWFETKYETIRTTKKPYLANRIDKETSGLIMVATDGTICQNLSQQFALNWIQKKYIAVVYGRIKEDQITHISLNKGKVCWSKFKVIERLRDLTVLKCSLYSGRTHQIRVHLKELGYPIFNDNKYSIYNIYSDTRSNKRRPETNFIALHAKSLAIIHPIFRTNIKFTAIIPFEIYLLINVML
ncbi:RluA family pseudouridine synthase [Candidatus Karelsulcia muelleri]